MSEKSSHWLDAVAQQVGLELDVPQHPDVGTVRKPWTQVVGVADTSTYDPQAARLIPESVAIGSRRRVKAVLCRSGVRLDAPRGGERTGSWRPSGTH